MLAATTLAGCAALFPDGDAHARNAIDDVVDGIAAHEDNTTEITLLEMVAWWVPEGPVHTSPGTVTVEPLTWSGAIGHETEATIEVRLHAEVEAYSPPTIGGSYGAGEATRCVRFVWERYEQARRSDIPCPDGPAPPRPTPEPRPSFDADDRERAASVLAASSTPEEVDADLRAAFPEEYVTIETALWEGETVVAVGIPRERECILLVKDAAGVVREEGYRRISLEPGETGCSTSLYTSPPF